MKLKYAIVPYPIPENLIKSKLIAQTQTSAVKNNSKDKCIVSYKVSYNANFSEYPNFDTAEELILFKSQNPEDWDPEYKESIEPTQVNIDSSPAFADNVLNDGSTLYLKIHGMKAVLPAASLDADGITITPTEHEFLFTLPYAESYLQGAEIFVDILAQTDMSVKHPLYGVLEQYGYNVCMGKVIYKREAKYAARLPMGLQVSAVCKNVELFEQEMGVNFILHEIRVS